MVVSAHAGRVLLFLSMSFEDVVHLCMLGHRFSPFYRIKHCQLFSSLNYVCTLSSRSMFLCFDGELCPFYISRNMYVCDLFFISYVWNIFFINPANHLSFFVDITPVMFFTTPLYVSILFYPTNFFPLFFNGTRDYLSTHLFSFHQ
jgi:hypothetical protein